MGKWHRLASVPQGLSVLRESEAPLKIECEGDAGNQGGDSKGFNQVSMDLEEMVYF